jgi:hypothetical protein
MSTYRSSYGFVHVMHDAKGKGSPSYVGHEDQKAPIHVTQPEARRKPGKKSPTPPRGVPAARKGTTKNRAAFERRMANLVRSNPEVAARLARGVGK